MTETDKLNPKPIYLRLLELVENAPCKYSLTMEELHDLFKRQAEIDDSGDKPELLSNSVFEVIPQGLHVFTPYTVSNPDNTQGKVGLVIEGIIKNDNKGFLSDEAEAVIYTDTDTKLRVFEAFGVEGSLPMKVYLKSMIEDALRGKVNIKNMSLEKNNLVLEIEKSKQG